VLVGLKSLQPARQLILNVGPSKEMKMKTLWGFLAGWFTVSLILTITIPPPMASTLTRYLIVLAPIAALVLLLTILPGFQRVMRQIPVRTLVFLHIIRLAAGALFILAASRKLLPYDFAWPAGIGDILAGSLALGIVVFFRRSAIPPAILAVWNIIGLLDFMNVQRVVVLLANAGRGAEFVAMQGPPLALIPYFVVPLLFFTHLYMLGRLAKNDRALFVKPVTPIPK
jgi:hypothetical protein